MRGMTKSQCLKIENLVAGEISKVLGPPKDEYQDGGSSLVWSMPYGETGTVRLHLICDSHEVGNVYRNTWLACRLDDRARHVGEDGYTKPKTEIEGGWPYPFTYPSGKCNLHFDLDANDTKRHIKDLAAHLYSISFPGSREKQEFGKIEFEIN